MATRIVDLDRGKLVTYPGNYDQYLLEKEEALRVEELQNAEFDRKLAQEEVWIRQGIKARRTRNGSVRDLQGAINGLLAYSIVYNSSIDIRLAERVIKRAFYILLPFNVCKIQVTVRLLLIEFFPCINNSRL